MLGLKFLSLRAYKVESWEPLRAYSFLTSCLGRFQNMYLSICELPAIYPDPSDDCPRITFHSNSDLRRRLRYGLNSMQCGLACCMQREGSTNGHGALRSCTQPASLLFSRETV